MQREEAGAATITVDAPGFHGSLEELVARANRGDIDLSELTVSTVIADARAALESPERSGDLRAVADALALLARLVALKAAAVLPDQIAATADPEEDISSDAGRRLAEYRLFKAAAEALLAEAATDGARSFLGLVSTEVIPVERLRIPPERLAAAFRAVLERLRGSAPRGDRAAPRGGDLFRRGQGGAAPGASGTRPARLRGRVRGSEQPARGG